MNQAIAKVDSAAIVRKVALSGNLKSLSENERWEYYEAFCRHLNLEPTTRPFDVMEREGKVSLYPNANCAAQLGERMGMSFPEYQTEIIMDCVFVYRVRAVTEDGREAWGTGAVPLGRSPLEIASAIKKAETQAKRRVTLSMGGLGITDSDEMEVIGTQVINSEPTQPEPKTRKAEPKPGRVFHIVNGAEVEGLPPEEVARQAEAAAESTRVAQEQSAAFRAEQKAKAAAELSIAGAKRTASEWFKKQSIKAEDQRLIWSRLDGNLELINSFLTIFPRQVPVVTSCALCLDSFIASDYDAEKALSDIAHKGSKIAAEIAGTVVAQSPPINAPVPIEKPTALPNAFVEICQTYEIGLAERPVIFQEFNGNVQDAEDFFLLRTSKDVPHDFPLDVLIQIWKNNDGHLRKSKQAVAAYDPNAAPPFVAHGVPGQSANLNPNAITPAKRSLKDDPVGFDATPFWKWIKTSELDATEPNRKRINQIIDLNSEQRTIKGKPEKVTNWQSVIHQVKVEFSA